MYRLGQVGTGTLAHDINRWWAMMRGQPDPTLKIGQTNDRTERGAAGEFVWALKDINFDVKQGEILGIIGRNGAGKSTLLKLLSRVTAPTTGTIKARGRIASLLEVGTGFHPELTGRENVYLNGAIMGMTKPEVTKRLDEIVEFSGCSKYIDTPVKRYSSGMTVRLGFAVAAHLDCEILIIDEVLAVGDAEFRKKCIQKMQEIHESGRTILFVSHNMDSIRAISDRVVLMEQGTVLSVGDVEEQVPIYLKRQQRAERSTNQFPIEIHKTLTLNSLSISKELIEVGDPLGFEMKFGAKQDVDVTELAVFINSDDGHRIAMVDLRQKTATSIDAGGEKTVTGKIASIPFKDGTYAVNVYVASDGAWRNVVNLASFKVTSDVIRNGVERFPVAHRGIVDLEYDFGVSS